MYRIITTDGTELGITDTVNYIRYGNSGCFVLCQEEDAIGVAFDGAPYNLIGNNEIQEADTVVVSKVDGGSMVSYQRSLIDELIITALEG